MAGKVKPHMNEHSFEHFMTFAVPLKMFRELESDVEASFLERPVWETEA